MGLETELKTEKDKQENIKNNNNIKVNMNKMDNKQKTANNGGNDDDEFREYPPESTVIQNLLQAQVEFYFSDYNLKRDKRLLSDVVKLPKKGFLELTEVMKLSRIRQLCSEIETLEEALRRSNILSLVRERKVKDENKENEEKDDKKQESADVSVGNESAWNIWVGRMDFEKPKEKEFPFRRTVFIFGIPVDSSEAFLREML